MGEAGRMRKISPSHMVVAIDGPSGTGKSTAAKRLACLLGYRYVDSGAMYRAVGWAIQQSGVRWENAVELAQFLAQIRITLTFRHGRSATWVNGQPVTEHLQGELVGKMASAVAMLPAVRHVITTQLRQLRCEAHLVMEGRDIGTVIFPDARVKFFLEAALDKRGHRRFQEMQQAGLPGTLEEVTQALAARDAQDRTRTAAPLQRSPDAYIIDTTDLAVDDVVQIMLSQIQGNIPTV
jgi:CMP/dCMP kinase